MVLQAPALPPQPSAQQAQWQQVPEASCSNSWAFADLLSCTISSTAQTLGELIHGELTAVFMPVSMQLSLHQSTPSVSMSWIFYLRPWHPRSRFLECSQSQIQSFRFPPNFHFISPTPLARTQAESRVQPLETFNPHVFARPHSFTWLVHVVCAFSARPRCWDQGAWVQAWEAKSGTSQRPRKRNLVRCYIPILCLRVFYFDTCSIKFQEEMINIFYSLCACLVFKQVLSFALLRIPTLTSC